LEVSQIYEDFIRCCTFSSLTKTKLGYIELALLNDAPRIATVRANGRLKCATLGKKAFTRLLGPVLDILKRNSENYHAIINQHGTSGLTQSK
jgi:hypothetical protein